MNKVTNKGLAGVVVDSTAISSIDGARGELRVRGYRIEELARLPFLDVVGLLLDGELPDAAGRRALALAHRERALPPGARAVLAALPHDTHPMTVLQVALPLLGGGEPTRRAEVIGAAARLSTVLATWLELRAGRRPTEPDPERDALADFLRRATGVEPSPRALEIFTVVQILQLEHGFNASTFTGRVVGSTRARLPAALAAAVGALSGPLHGGADEAAYCMALAIGRPAAAAEWVERELAAGRRIMGLGHREYRVVDPRAVVLRDLALELAELSGMGDVVRTLLEVDAVASERLAGKERAIRANVEFYKGAVFAALGIPTDAFTAAFATARVYGWGAHLLELGETAPLVRPAAAYHGPAPRSVA